MIIELWNEVFGEQTEGHREVMQDCSLKDRSLVL
jgi:hypothetical protein